MNYFYVYILKCSDGSYYVGHTDNIEKRIAEHKLGVCSDYTSRRRPIEIVFLEKFQTRNEAFVIERKIKGWSRKKKEALIVGDWNKIKKLSNQKNIHPSTGSG
jgi:predicted GIY-YIG superfamily endonuclease